MSKRLYSIGFAALIAGTGLGPLEQLEPPKKVLEEWVDDLYNMDWATAQPDNKSDCKLNEIIECPGNEPDRCE